MKNLHILCRTTLDWAGLWKVCTCHCTKCIYAALRKSRNLPLFLFHANQLGPRVLARGNPKLSTDEVSSLLWAASARPNKNQNPACLASHPDGAGKWKGNPVNVGNESNQGPVRWPHCKDKMPKIWNKYSQKRNIGVSVPIPTFKCLWANYIFPRCVCLFWWRKYVGRSWEYINRSQTHECGNWGWGRAIPRKGIYKRNCRCSASPPVTTLQTKLGW